MAGAGGDWFPGALAVLSRAGRSQIPVMEIAVRRMARKRDFM